ncbi:hypothetical protein diail_8085 [Diaporthe ilicicola]|nr:hypothetical protein diail_8085 [Diaporthe ilicicola]
MDCHHEGCDECHTSMTFDEIFTNDLNDHFEKVVEIALNMVHAFHEEILPMIKSVDVSARSGNDICCLVVEDLGRRNLGRKETEVDIMNDS